MERWIDDHPAAAKTKRRALAVRANNPGANLAALSPAIARFESSYDPPTFREALEFQMKRHGETVSFVHKHVVMPGDRFCSNAKEGVWFSHHFQTGVMKCAKS